MLNNFHQVSAIILSNSKGEAVSVAIPQRRREFDLTEQQQELPRIIEKSYAELGRDSLGGKALKPQLSGSPEKDTLKQSPASSKKKWEITNKTLRKTNPNLNSTKRK